MDDRRDSLPVGGEGSRGGSRRRARRPAAKLPGIDGVVREDEAAERRRRRRGGAQAASRCTTGPVRRITSRVSILPAHDDLALDRRCARAPGAPRARSRRASSVSAVLRLAAVDRPLNIDEALWIQRGGRLRGPRWPEATSSPPTPGPPGVTTMWLVGYSNVACCTSAGRDPGRPCAGGWPTTPASRCAPTWCRAACRRLFTSALLALMASLAVQWLGLRAGTLGCALLAFEPFLPRLSSVSSRPMPWPRLWGAVRRSGSVSTAGGGRRRLVLSGVAFGLAVATKLPVGCWPLRC
jgi:hypothetical protein